MNYLEVKNQLNLKIEYLYKKLSKHSSKDDYEKIKRQIDNYLYILELTEMNHFLRGLNQ